MGVMLKSLYVPVSAAGAALLLVLLLLLQLIGCGGSGPSGPPAREVSAIPVRAVAVERGDLEVYAGYPGELVGEAADVAPPGRYGGRARARGRALSRGA